MGWSGHGGNHGTLYKLIMFKVRPNMVGVAWCSGAAWHGMVLGRHARLTVHWIVRCIVKVSHNLLGTADCFQMDRDYFVFQQDNDPKHTSRLANDWFNQNRVNLMDWPPQSPDMNPIKHLWHALKQRLRTYPEPPKGIHELWERIQDEWLKIPVETCQNLISNMPGRIQALLKAKGGYTKYWNVL